VRELEFIRDLDAAVRPLADKEFQMLLAEKRKSDPKATTIGLEGAATTKSWCARALQFRLAIGAPVFPVSARQAGNIRHRRHPVPCRVSARRRRPGVDPAVETWQVIDGARLSDVSIWTCTREQASSLTAEMVQVLDGIRGKQLPEAH
jgi:hypothetical protein